MALDPYQTAPRYLNQASKPQAACIMLDCHRHVVFCARPIGISGSNQPGHVQNRCHSPLSRSRSICDKGSPRARLRIPYTRQKFLPILCYAPCSRYLALLQVGFLRLNYHSRLTRYVAFAVLGCVRTPNRNYVRSPEPSGITRVLGRFPDPTGKFAVPPETRLFWG